MKFVRVPNGNVYFDHDIQHIFEKLRDFNDVLLAQEITIDADEPRRANSRELVDIYRDVWFNMVVYPLEEEYNVVINNENDD